MRNEDEHCEFEISAEQPRCSVSHDETAQIKATLLEERSLHFNRSLRVVHRLLRGHLVPSHQDSRHPQSFQPFKSNFIPDPEGTISFALQSAPSRLVRGSSSQRAIYRLYPAGSIKGLGLRTTSSVPWLPYRKWRVRPQKHITWE